MGAFQAGFGLGSRIASDALDRQERAERQKREDEERGLRNDLTRLQIGAANEDARRRTQIAEITRGISDTTQGIDRAATSAALDADFNSALQASEAAVKAQNVARQTPQPATAPSPSAVPADVAAEPGAAVGPATGITPTTAPLVRGGSNLANEQALTVRNTVDPLSPEYRQRLTGQMAQLAAASGDIERLRSIEAERRTVAEDSVVSQRIKDYKATDDQIGTTTAFINQTSRRITMSQPDKNGLVGLSVVAPDGKARFETLSRAEQAKLYAAVGLLEVNPTRAMKMMEEVNKDLAQALKDENLVTSQVATNTNTVAQTSANISNTDADNKRADAAAAAAAGERRRAQDEARTKAAAAVTLFKQNNPNATQADLDAVRTGIISAAPAAIGKDAPAVVQLAQWALQAKMPGINNMADALQWANQSREKSQKEFEQDIYAKALTASMGDTKTAQRAVTEARSFFVPAGGAPGPQPSAAPGAAPAPGKRAPLTFKTEAEAEAAGAAGKIPAGSTITITNGPGGRPIEGVKWLPAAPRPAAPVVPAPAAQPLSPQAVADEFANVGAVPR